MTSNEEGGPAVYAFDRAKMLNGQPAKLQRFLASQLTGFGFQALTPIDLDGTSAPPPGSPFQVLRHRDDEVHNISGHNADKDFLDLFEVKIDWVNPANSTMTGPNSLAIAEFDSDLNGLTSISCFPQKGSTVRLDPLREVIMHRLPYRHFKDYETMVGSFVTDVDARIMVASAGLNYEERLAAIGTSFRKAPMLQIAIADGCRVLPWMAPAILPSPTPSRAPHCTRA